jgi:hypothetical protein
MVLVPNEYKTSYGSIQVSDEILLNIILDNGLTYNSEEEMLARHKERMLAKHKLEMRKYLKIEICVSIFCYMYMLIGVILIMAGVAE